MDLLSICSSCWSLLFLHYIMKLGIYVLLSLLWWQCWFLGAVTGASHTGSVGFPTQRVQCSVPQCQRSGGLCGMSPLWPPLQGPAVPWLPASHEEKAQCRPLWWEQCYSFSCLQRIIIMKLVARGFLRVLQFPPFLHRQMVQSID